MAAEQGHRSGRAVLLVVSRSKAGGRLRWRRWHGRCQWARRRLWSLSWRAARVWTRNAPWRVSVLIKRAHSGCCTWFVVPQMRGHTCLAEHVSQANGGVEVMRTLGPGAVVGDVCSVVNPARPGGSNSTAAVAWWRWWRASGKRAAPVPAAQCAPRPRAMQR